MKKRFHLCVISNNPVLTLDKPLAIRICGLGGEEGLHWIRFKSACGQAIWARPKLYKENVSLPRLADLLSNVVLQFRELLVEAQEIVLSGRKKNKSIIAPTSSRI
jgi:hypothetical protein